MIRHLAIAATGLLSAVGTPAATDWPDFTPARAADTPRALGGNLSGLVSDGADGLWAVRDTGALMHLQRSGAAWVSGGDRTLSYPGGDGSPDAEGVTTVAGDDAAVYVAAERNNDAPNNGRNSILRYEHAGTGALAATREWKLDAIIGSTPANTGIEGVTWVPDSVLVAAGYRTSAGKAYAPADYADHGSGLFIAALESSGDLFALALHGNGRATLVGRVSTGLDAVMDLSWNAAQQELWAVCDNHCNGHMAVLHPADGSFQIAAIVRPPAGMSDLNNEGFAILPTCSNGTTVAVWSDDGATAGTALREANLACQPLAAPAHSPAAPVNSSPTTIPPTNPSSAPTASGSSTVTAPTPASATASPVTTSPRPAPSTGPSRTPLVAALAALTIGMAALLFRQRRSRRRR